MRKIVFISALACSAHVFSVGLLTQYHLGTKFIEKENNYTQRDKNLFLLGVWFPGIWYTSENTLSFQRSFNNMEISEILHEGDPFKKGILFHHFLHSQEKAFFQDSYFQKSLTKDMPYEIKECYLNILEDLLFTHDPLVADAKLLLNEIMYSDFNPESFSEVYSLSDIVKWYYTILISITTPPLEIPDHVTFSNTYKGLKVTVDINSEMLEEAKGKLPNLSQDPKILDELRTFIQHLTGIMSI